MPNQTENYEGIAIIGMSGRFPEAVSVQQYWENLCAGKECISFFSEETVLDMGILPELVKDPNYVRARGVIRDIDCFDAEFFGFTPRDAEITDPQQRLFMECAWEAMESAGYSPDSSNGPVGVFAGSSLSNYLFLIHTSPELVGLVGSFQIEIGNDKDFLATRTSYKLNLSGPSLSVNTACSTSLVAVTLACQSLLGHQCDMALAGGVALGAIPQRTGYTYKPGGILSPDGHCRAFDAKARGTVGGNGLGVVLLKRLEDAVADGDPVIAVIRGFAINNDGAMKVGFTAPSADGQAAVICEALANAAVDPETVSYVEAHGTGTILGDPIEVEALTRAFRLGTDKKQFCAIGSAKTNVGHLDAAAGMAGLIKTALAVKHAVLPPSLHYEAPNPQIDFANSPFYVNASLTPWQPEAGIRRAGVSSFGIGGTNVHLVLEEAPAPWQSGASREAQLLPISARNAEALQQASDNLQNYLCQNQEVPLADVSFTLANGRRAFAHRMACVANSKQQAVDKLSAREVLQGEWKGSARPLVFLLSGQGSQFVHMGRDLYEKESVFRREIDFAAGFLKPYLGCDLRNVIFAEGENEIQRAETILRQTWMTQPALYAFERALLKQWESWGVRPTALIGHSLGELVAANATGVLSDEDALILVAERGRLMWKTEPGVMLSAMTDEASAQRFVRTGVSVAAVNGKQQIVFSGAVAPMSHLELELAQAGIVYRKLDVERAFHSETMEPVRDEFLQMTRSLKFNQPMGRFISNVTGQWAGPEVAQPEYWWQQVRSSVRFADGIQQLMEEEDWMWLEVGPSELLAKLVRSENRAAWKKSVVVASLGGAAEKNQEQTKLVTALGELWVNGAEVDWQSYYQEEKRRHVSLPTYPFQRQSYWVTFPEEQPADQQAVPPQEAAPIAKEEKPSGPAPSKVTDIKNQAANETEIVITRVWQQYLGMSKIGNDQNFFALGGDSLLVIQVATKLRELLEMDIPIEAFLEQPTIAGLAKKILAMKKSNSKSSVLVPMRTSGSRQPFFAVHPIGGGAFIFRQLMEHLGEEQPFYGFQALGLADIGDEGDPYISLEQMAAEYIQAMRAVQKQGPYLLSGLSWGGVLAFEMAQQLTAAGEAVSLLALFDTPSPVELAKLSALDDATILVGLARDLAFQRGIELPLTAEDVQKLPAGSQVQRVLSELQNNGLLTDEATANWLQKHLQGYRSRLCLIQQYQPAVYSGKITFFRAGELDDVMTEHLDLVQVDYNREAFAWEDLSAQPIDVHVVPGNHSEIVFEPNVQILVERLNACISKSVPCTV